MSFPEHPLHSHGYIKIHITMTKQDKKHKKEHKF